MPSRFWGEMTTLDFRGLDPEKTVALLPIAAIEQHGPHLPVCVDTAIADGMVKAVMERVPDDLTVLVLPTQAVGKSNEHLRSPGTLTLTAQTALAVWNELGDSVARAGVRKLIMMNSHGGNSALAGGGGARAAHPPPDAVRPRRMAALRHSRGPLLGAGRCRRHPCRRYRDLGHAAFAP